MMDDRNLSDEELYYYDLGYAIRKRMGMPMSLNLRAEKRIHERMHCVSVISQGKYVDKFSPFALDIFATIDKIKIEAGVTDINLKNVRFCHEATNSVLNDINSSVFVKAKK